MGDGAGDPDGAGDTDGVGSRGWEDCWRVATARAQIASPLALIPYRLEDTIIDWLPTPISGPVLDCHSA